MQLVKTINSGICPKFMSIHSELNHLSLIIISLVSLYKSVKYPHMAWRAVCVCVCVCVCLGVCEVV